MPRYLSISPLTFLWLLLFPCLNLFIKVHNLSLHLPPSVLVQHEIGLLLLGPPHSPPCPETLLPLVSPPLSTNKLPHEVQDPPQW